MFSLTCGIQKGKQETGSSAQILADTETLLGKRLFIELRLESEMPYCI